MKKLLPLLLLILIGCSKDDGPYEDYYPNGKVRGDGTFKNNKVEGLFTIYYDEGQILKEFQFSDGKRNGKMNWYFKNGKLKVLGYYKDDKQDGPYKYYNENGQLELEETYKDGILIESKEYWSICPKPKQHSRITLFSSTNSKKSIDRT